MESVTRDQVRDIVSKAVLDLATRYNLAVPPSFPPCALLT